MAETAALRSRLDAYAVTLSMNELCDWLGAGSDTIWVAYRSMIDICLKQ